MIPTGKWPVVITVVLLFALCATYGAAAPGMGSSPADPPQTSAAPQPPSPTERAEMIRAIAASSVKIILGSEDKGAVTETQSSSGVVIYSEKAPKPWSLVLTNAHAVTPEGPPGNDEVFMSYVAPTGRRLLRAKVIARGKLEVVDLALVRVEGVSLPAVRFQSMKDVELGNPVLVASSPFGRELSITSGIISQMYLAGPPAMEKECAAGTVPASLCLVPKPLEEIFKTDAPICYGSSGGGVFLTSTGRLVGLVESYQSADIIIRPKPGEEYKVQIPVPGESFLISVNKIKYFLEQNGLDLAGGDVVMAATAKKSS